MEDYVNLIQAFSSPENDDQKMAREFVALNNTQSSFYENLLTIVCDSQFNSLQK
jgi:hypothetical protein